MKKARIDTLLVEHGLAKNIEEARRFIMAGLAIANDKRIDKAGDTVPIDSELRLKDRMPYVSRGGYKLQKAVDVFKVDFVDKTVIDIGSSTGGFTDVALKSGALKVYAIDVGSGLIHERLRQDKRVILLENTNFRTIQFDTVGEFADIIVTDVSFISLTMIFPQSVLFSKKGTQFIALIKPQFEAEREEVPQGGVVIDKSIHKAACIKAVTSATSCGYELQDLTISPITGAKGNVEYLAYFVYTGKIMTNINNEIIEREFR